MRPALDAVPLAEGAVSSGRCRLASHAKRQHRRDPERLSPGDMTKVSGPPGLYSTHYNSDTDGTQ